MRAKRPMGASRGSQWPRTPRTHTDHAGLQPRWDTPRQIHLTDVDPLLRLVYVVEEEPLPETASMGAFVSGQFLELVPGQAEGCREGMKDLQDVRQLSGR